MERLKKERRGGGAVCLLFFQNSGEKKSRKGGICRKNGLHEWISNSENVLNVTFNLGVCALTCVHFNAVGERCDPRL